MADDTQEIPEPSNSEGNDIEGNNPQTNPNEPDLAKKGKVITSASFAERDVDFSKSPVGVLEAELSEARAETKENYDKYLRALAELENYKKRVVKERSELLKYQGDRIFVDILDVVDDLDRAMDHLDADPQQLKSGIELIHKRFIDVLSKWDVRGETAVGKEFNPTFQSAISKIKSPNVAPGTIVGELKKTYFYKDKLIRHGEVVVADGD